MCQDLGDIIVKNVFLEKDIRSYIFIMWVNKQIVSQFERNWAWCYTSKITMAVSFFGASFSVHYRKDKENQKMELSLYLNKST